MLDVTEHDAGRVAVFGRERPHLLAVAFRILGSDADAQDVVQEAWIRYARADLGHVQNVAAWLTTVVTRLCLDLLRRAREYPRQPTDLPVDPAGDGDSPEQIALLAGELTEAFVIVLDELTPPQRVALVLHDVFGTPFDEVARILDTTPASAKKLASRARGRVRRPVTAADADLRAARRVVSAFLRAAQLGEVDGLVRLLHPDVTRTADPQALPAGAAQRVRGAQAVVAETRALQAGAVRARVVTINGRPGIAVMADQGVRAALVFRIADDRITHYDVIADPQRLALLHIASGSELRRGADKVPLVAGDVGKHRDTAVEFGARRGEEAHARGCHPRVRGVEVLDVQEEAHASGRLLPDDGGLIFPVSPREQQAGRRSRRPDHHPPLGTSVVGQGRGVLDELEAQCVHEEADSGVVLADHDGDQAQMHSASIKDGPA
jgi:RNA polymerase sigma factor (sigma-70 family)